MENRAEATKAIYLLKSVTSRHKNLSENRWQNRPVFSFTKKGKGKGKVQENTQDAGGIVKFSKHKYFMSKQPTAKSYRKRQQKKAGGQPEKIYTNYKLTNLRPKRGRRSRRPKGKPAS